MLCLILKRVLWLINIFMNPKLPLDGRIYTLTLGSVLTTNVSQINLCQLLFRATLKVSMFVTTLGMDNFDCTKMNAHFKKIHSLSTGGAHSRVEASITSPTSPPYVAKQLTVLFHTQPLFSFLVYGNIVPTIYCAF